MLNKYGFALLVEQLQQSKTMGMVTDVFIQLHGLTAVGGFLDCDLRTE